MSYVIKETYSNPHKKIDIYYAAGDKWTMTQKDAVRFNSRISALSVCDSLNREGSGARVVRLKAKKDLVEPKVSTVFLEYVGGGAIPNIVTGSYLDRDDEFPDSKPVKYVCAVCSDTSRGDDVWGTIEEYHDYLSKGKIQIIWEPK